MTDRLKVKFLIAIWGARYIQEFARVSLPSYLAAGNLPAVAEAVDLEIVVLTSADSRDEFDNVPLFGRLSELCPVKFLLIDDLITNGNYGVTLTLAYARGIRDSGDEQTNTHFVFMNSDFVLADGSLRSLVAKMDAGHRCVMAPSLRATSEMVLPPLTEYVDNGVLAVPPRVMVDLTFRNLHPTVIGKTVTQHLCTCMTHNQIYWQVDEHTLLGRYHLIFMLAIKPEVPMGKVNSYCDYGFIPELVPSGEFTMMDDSDEFFMLELQPAAQEMQLMRGGTSSPSEVAAQLSEWATHEHRRFADVDVVFHAGDLPDNFDSARRDFARYFAKVRALMGAEPKHHAEHIYWALGVQAWEQTKFGAGVSHAMPAELGGQNVTFETTPAARKPPLGLAARARSSIGRWYVGLLGYAYERVGSMPNVPLWHHQWLDSRLVQEWLAALSKGSRQNNLMLCSEDSVLAGYFSRTANFDVEKGLGKLLGDEGGLPLAAPEGHAGFDHIFVHIYRADMLRTAKVLDAVRGLLKPGGDIAVFFEHKLSESEPSNFTLELAQYVEHILPSDWMRYRVSVKFAGGRFKRWLRLAERKVVRNLFPSSPRRLPFLLAAIVLWPIVAAMTAVNNLTSRDATETCPEYCSSFLMTLSASAEQIAAERALVAKLENSDNRDLAAMRPAAVRHG